MDGVIQRIEASDIPDLIQGALCKRFMFGPTFLLNEGGGDHAHVAARDLGGVRQDALLLQLITLGLHQVDTFAAELRSPVLLRGGPVLITESKCGVIGAHSILESTRHVFIESRDVHSVEGMQLTHLSRSQQSGVDGNLREDVILVGLLEGGESQEVDWTGHGWPHRLLGHRQKPKVCVFAMQQWRFCFIDIKSRT